MFLELSQNQRCLNVEFYRCINVEKSTLNQRGYHIDRRRDVISTYINVGSTLSVCWECFLHTNIKNILNNNKFRRILSAIGIYNYNLANFFVPMLKQFTINEYTVKDSFSFSKEILDQDPNLFMASFDN